MVYLMILESSTHIDSCLCKEHQFYIPSYYGHKILWAQEWCVQ